METIAQAFPDLCADLVRALEHSGRGDLARQVPSAEIAEVTFDNSANAGYIYAYPVGTAHGETIPLENLMSVVLDVDTSGKLQGVELLSPAGNLKSELRRRAAV
jgi:uncharacterized protein YuzE